MPSQGSAGSAIGEQSDLRAELACALGTMRRGRGECNQDDRLFIWACSVPLRSPSRPHQHCLHIVDRPRVEGLSLSVTMWAVPSRPLLVPAQAGRGHTMLHTPPASMSAAYPDRGRTSGSARSCDCGGIASGPIGWPMSSASGRRTLARVAGRAGTSGYSARQADVGPRDSNPATKRTDAMGRLAPRQDGARTTAQPRA
jgi:hypothetical protein